MEEFGVPKGHERPYARDNRNSNVFYSAQKRPQLFGVKDRLRNRVLRPGFNFVFKSFDLVVQIDCSWVHPDPNAKGRRLADRVVAQVKSVIQLVHHVCQTNRVDVKHGSGVRVRSHLWRIACNQ